MKRVLSLVALASMAILPMFAEEDVNPCLKCTSPKGGSNAWDRQVQYKLISGMTAGKAYTLKVDFKATEACSLGCWPIWTTSPNRNQWGNSSDVQYLNSYDITTEWKTYTWKFTANFDLDELDFVFGTLNGNLFVDNVILKEDAVGVNMVTDGEFNERKTDGWSTLGYNGQAISIVDSEGGTLPPPGAPEIPDTWELAQQGNPKCHVFLAFGQSNMEGNAQPENVDKQNVPGNFLTLAAVNFSNPSRTKGHYYTAVPPLCRQGTGLTPCDYFGRTLVDKLGTQDTVVVINVAVGGARIELFMQEFKDDYIAGEAGWFQGYCAEYGNDPLGRLVEMGKIAQQRGVIEGVLLHQGESNNGASDWADKVKEIHKRLCYYLGLSITDTPLLAGETLYQNQGGSCYWHNTAALPMIPQVMPGYGYVISAEGCPGNGSDPWHFNCEGYRMLGKRYAEKMYEIMQEKANGIVTIESLDLHNSRSFDLSGRPCNDTPHGLYISDGKIKMIKK